MKKVLLTMAALTGLVAGGMVFSSFTTQKQAETAQFYEVKLTDRIVASNKKCPYTTDDGRTGYHTINVYTSDISYSYYAIVDVDRDQTPYTVIENSGYGKSDTKVGFHGEIAGNYRYYIIYNNKYIYFNL